MPPSSSSSSSSVTRFLHVAVHRDGPALNALPHLSLREGRIDVPQSPLLPLPGQAARTSGSVFAGAGGAANAEPPVVVTAGAASFVPCVAGISRNGSLLATSAGCEHGLEVRVLHVLAS